MFYFVRLPPMLFSYLFLSLQLHPRWNHFSSICKWPNLTRSMDTKKVSLRHNRQTIFKYRAKKILPWTHFFPATFVHVFAFVRKWHCRQPEKLQHTSVYTYLYSSAAIHSTELSKKISIKNVCVQLCVLCVTLYTIEMNQKLKFNSLRENWKIISHYFIANNCFNKIKLERNNTK